MITCKGLDFRTMYRLSSRQNVFPELLCFTIKTKSSSKLECHCLILNSVFKVRFIIKSEHILSDTSIIKKIRKENRPKRAKYFNKGLQPSINLFHSKSLFFLKQHSDIMQSYKLPNQASFRFTDTFQNT